MLVGIRCVNCARMPTQLIAAMDLPTAARAAMRIAVDSDDPRPLLYAAQLLIDACMDPDNEAS